MVKPHFFLVFLCLVLFFTTSSAPKATVASGQVERLGLFHSEFSMTLAQNGSQAVAYVNGILPHNDFRFLKE